MKIGIDARLYRETGVGRYLRNLISNLSVIDKVNEYVIYLSQKEYSKFSCPGPNFQKKILNVGWHSFSEQVIVPFVFLRDKIDVTHFPYFNVPVFYPKKYLLTIHDLIIDHFDTGRASTLPYLLYRFKRIAYKIVISIGIKRARLISVISKTTKKEVAEHYKVNPKNIYITYDALDDNFKFSCRKSKPVKFYDFDYFLYVGNAYPHKNLENLILAFERVRKKINLKLVLAGDDPYFYKRMQKDVHRRGLEKDIIFFGNAGDKDLVSLYKYSRFLVFPSYMEGFGLPNFEALYCGKLPLVSDIPVFREIWKDKILFFDPADVSDLAEKIVTTYELSEKKYKSLVEKATGIIKNYSWKNTAGETLKLYKKINS